MKKVLCLLLAVVLMLGVAGCGGTVDTDSESIDKNVTDTIQKQDSGQKFDIDDLTIRTEYRLVDGEKLVCFEYDNNTGFTISKAEIKYKLKDNVDEAAIKALGGSFTDADYDDFYIDGYCPIVTKSGESAKNAPFSISEEIALDDDRIFEYVEPDTLSVLYVGKDGYLHGFQYEYETKEVIESADLKKAYQWSDSELAKLLPTPDAEIIEVEFDDEEEFEAEVRISSLAFFDNYVQACKDAGFVLEHDADSTSYEAKNAQGYKLEIYLWSRSYQVDIMIEAPES